MDSKMRTYETRVLPRHARRKDSKNENRTMREDWMDSVSNEQIKRDGSIRWIGVGRRCWRDHVERPGSERSTKNTKSAEKDTEKRREKRCYVPIRDC